jgi:hypothetical protein
VYRARVISLTAATVVLTAISFQAGRRVVVARREHDDAARQSRANSANIGSTRIRLNSDDDHKIRLENLAAVPFAELYDLIRAASPETRSNWAKQLEALPASPRKLAAIESFYKTLVQLDAKAAVELVLGIGDRRVQRIAADAVIGTFREADIKIIAEMLMNLPTASRRRMRLSQLAGEWLQIDPPTAIECVEHHRDQLSDDEFYSFMWTWTLLDPSAARSWFERQTLGQQRKSAIRGVVLGWYQRDPAAAVEYAAAHADSKEFRDVMGEIANGVIRDTPDEPADFIKEMPDGYARDALIKAVVESTKGRQPVNSADDVVKWLVALPNSIWTGHVDDLLAAWEGKDGAAVLYWIEELPVETRAQLLAEHSPHGDGIPSARAFALALNISDRKLRDAALQKFAESLGTTREEALHSLQDLSVSAAQKRYLRSFLKTK